MNRIYKYRIKIRDVQVLSLPKDARVLCFQLQDDIPCIWAVIDDRAPKEERTFYIFGTGHPMTQEWGQYHGTIQQHGLVWHLFEKLT